MNMSLEVIIGYKEGRNNFLYIYITIYLSYIQGF